MLVAFATDAQTVSLVKNINPYGDAKVSWMTAYKNVLLFNATDGIAGRELWVSDGTLVGTYMLKDIEFPYGSDPGEFFVTDSGAYFYARTNTYGTELYFTDATSSGSRLVKDIDKTTIVVSGSFPTGFHEYAGKIYFFGQEFGYRGTYVTDGTDTGTKNLQHCAVLVGGPCGGRDFQAYNNKLYYVGSSNSYGHELFYFDSLDNSAKLLKDIYPGANNSSPTPFAKVRGYLLFAATDPVNGRELWRTDGTDTGTKMIYNINGKGSADPSNFTLFNNALYFTANDSINGVELWSTSGDSANTKILLDINANGSSNPNSLYVYNNKIYFAANDGVHGTELWVSDGTKSGTVLLKDLLPGIDSSMPDRFMSFKGWLFFRAKDSTGYQLWVTDGTSSGTRVIKPSFATNASPLESSYLVVTDSILYLNANYDTSNMELYKVTVDPLYVTDKDSEMLLFNIEVYPNPTNGDVIIRSNIGTGIFKYYELVDIQGRIIEKAKLSNSTVIVSLSAQPKGLYFVKVYTDDMVVYKKLVRL